MAAMSIEVDKGDIAKLNKLFVDMEKYTKKKADDLIQQTMLFAIKSAANATNPRSTQNPEGNYRKLKLGNKYLLRPMVALPQSMGFWYYQDGVFKPFKVPRKLSNRELKAKNLKRITKAVKIWNKNGGGWKYLPYPGTKRNKADKRFRIPHAGLAKAAWYRARSGLDKKFTYQGLKRNKKIHGIHNIVKRPLLMEAVNKVRYAGKTSPGAARYGLSKATRKMEANYLPQIDKAIQRRANK